MDKPKKIEENGKTYDLTDVDTINVREKMTVLEIPIPEHLRRIRDMVGMEGYALGVKSVCDFVPTDKHIAKMSHAIGLDNKRPIDGCYEAYRNGSFYNKPDELWDDLVVAGYATDYRAKNDYRYFVSPKGFRFLAKHHTLMIRCTNEYEGRE